MSQLVFDEDMARQLEAVDNSPQMLAVANVAAKGTTTPRSIRRMRLRSR